MIAFAILSALAMLWHLAYAIECSVVSGNMDRYMSKPHSSDHTDITAFEMRGRYGGGTDWYSFELEDGTRVAETQHELENAGFDRVIFEQICDETVEFSYTKLIRPWTFRHQLVDISYNGTHLTSVEVMQEGLRNEATAFYIIAACLMIVPFAAVMYFGIDWAVILLRKRNNQKNRKRKKEKKERYYAKQKQADDHTNSIKGDKL